MNTRIQAIVGLGNPESRYEDTRHNAGFWFVDLLSEYFNCSWRIDKKLQSYVSDFQFEITNVKIFKPTTYMNLSGRAVSLLINYYKIPIESILVVHDDIDIDTGNIKFKFDGGHGGHNGLKSIIESIGTKSFYRLRIGVGRPNNSVDVQDYVLQKPTTTHQKIIQNSLDEVVRLMPDFLHGNHENAMKQLHTRI